MKKITLFVVALFASVALYAQPFKAGTYTVGTGGTFETLSAAADSLTKAGGIAGDVVLEIISDIAETQNVGIIGDLNNTGYTLTIRPDKDEDRTITFAQTTDNKGPSGAICIGIRHGNGLNHADAVATAGITIDGYAVGGGTRRLTIETLSTQNIYNGPILFYGAVTNCTVKNCKLIHQPAVNKSCYGVNVRCQNATANAPAGTLIDNNYIEIINSGSGQGIGINKGSNGTADISNTTIKNNEINARTRGLFINGGNNVDFGGNTVRINQTNASTLSHGVMGYICAGTINIRGNKFLELKTANSTTGDYGICGITASGGDIWTIENNYITGFDRTSSAAPNECKIVGIRCGSTCIIRHNTIVMPALTNVPTGTILTSNYPVSLIHIAAGTPEIKNNILICNDTVANASLIRGTNGGESDYNLFYIPGTQGNAYVNAAATLSRTFVDYQTNNPTVDKNSIWKDVEFSDLGTGDLSLTGTSVNDTDLGVPRLNDVLTDIMGTLRATTTYVGAHEASDLTGISTEMEETKETFRVFTLSDGIQIRFEGSATIEVFSINGMLIDRTQAVDEYSLSLNRGIYIVRVNGQVVKVRL